MAVDINRVRVLRRVARECKSQALEADALHFSTDILSSAVVLVGVLAVWAAEALRLPEPLSRVLSQADTVAALLVAALIFKASMHMAAEAVDMLMDSGPSHSSEAIVAAVKNVEGISEVRRVRVRTSGSQSFVDLSVGVAPGLKVSDGHRLAHEAEQAVAAILHGADVTVHVEPRKSCRIDEKNPFALVQTTASEHGLAIHDVHILSAATVCHIELHVELPGHMPFARAYERVSAFEETLRRLLPGVEIVSHLEPKDPGTPLEAGASVSVPYSEMAWREIKAAVAKEPLSGQPHKFSTYVLPEQGVCISFHCNVSAGLSVEEAHNVCMFEVRPAPGIRVSRIANLSDDLALALKAVAVRIQAPIPGTDTVGIEIPNENRETVNFRELAASEAFRKGCGPLTMLRRLSRRPEPPGACRLWCAAAPPSPGARRHSAPCSSRRRRNGPRPHPASRPHSARC